MKTIVLAATALLAPSLAYASKADCFAYDKAINADDDTLRHLKSVDPLKQTLRKVELGMVQTTILVGNPSLPLTASRALKEFTDAENDNSAAGDLDYQELKVGTRAFTFVRVTYYPGDNEYGALFRFDDSDASATLIGLIEDGSTVCLTYPE